MCKERQRYLESLVFIRFNRPLIADLGFFFVLIRIDGGAIVQAIYIEAIAMVEEYQQAVSVANLGGIRDIHGLYPQLGLKSLPQVPNYLLTISHDL